MMDNKKIRNATKVISDNIEFKSKLEETIYNTLKDEGISAEYEAHTYTLLDSFVPSFPYYDRETKGQMERRLKKGEDKTLGRTIILKDKKIISVKYTPDFSFDYKGITVFIEAKGIENDVFYIKKKMFIRTLMDLMEKDKNFKPMYFEIYTKKQLLRAISIIKEYSNELI